MKNLKELKEAISSKAILVWNDPDPIDGNDYTISFVEPLEDIEDDEDISDYPILIQYNEGMSEAEVFIHEIIKK